MIYTYNREIDVPGFECTKKVLICNKDENGVAENTAAIIHDRKSFEKLKAEYDVKVAVIPGDSVPVLIVADNEPSSDVSAVQGLLYSKLSQLEDADAALAAEFMKNLINALSKQLGDVESSKLIVLALRLQYNWEKSQKLQSPFFVDAVDYDTDLRDYTVTELGKMNEKFTNSLSMINAADNNTVFQETCTSKFFIEIPTEQELLDADSMHELMPLFDEICKPYADAVATTPRYKTVLAGNQSLIHDIEGDRKNNTDEVFDNEKSYYDAICEWIKFNMKEQYGTSDGDVIDNASERYLLELITTVYMLHWRHSENVPDEIDEDSSDDFDCEDRFVFNNKRNSTNGVIILGEFLKEVSAEIGYKAYVLALIQIARWGARKPTSVVFEGYPREFNLEAGMVRAKVGDISQYSIVHSNGKDSRLLGIIVENKVFKDASVGITVDKIPVGIITETKMSKNSEDEVSLLDYYHFIDLIPLVKAGQTSIDGLEYVNGEWKITLPEDYCEATVNELITSYERGKDSLLKFPFYRSKELIDLYTKVNRNTSSMLPNLFSIMNSRMSDTMLVKNTGDAKFDCYNDVLEIIASQRNMLNSTPTVIEYGIVGRLLPVYQEVCKSKLETTAEIIDAWDKALSVFDGLPTLEGKTTKKITSFGGDVNVPVPQKNNVIEKVVAASGTVVSERVSDGDNSAVTGSGDWYKIVAESTPVSPITLPDGRVIGYSALEKVNPSVPGKRGYTRYTVLTDAGNREVVQDNPISVYRIMALLLHNIYLMQTGASMRQVYFADQETLNTFKTVLNNISKE